METPAELDLAAYSVEAVDGGIGEVDEATYEASSSYLVVDTGPWIFGKKVLIPAGVVDRVDDIEQVVYVDRAKDDIENAPEFDGGRYRGEDYRAEVGDYYGRGV
ncbi:MAG: PRC-barrel domain containing protein [Gaiellaceae bacterium]